MAKGTFRELLKNVMILSAQEERTKTQTRILGSRRDLLDKREQLFSIDRRRVIIPLVNQHKAEIKTRFPSANINDVVDSVELIFRNTINKFVDGRKIYWLDTRKTEIIAPNFRALQDFITKVKKDIRNQAFSSINQTNRKLKNKDSDLASGFVLTGNDLRPEDQGGDVIKKDLKNGVIVGNNRLTRQALGRKTGFEIGHTFGAGVANITAFTGVFHDNDIIQLFQPNIQTQLREYRQRARKLDGKLITDIALFKKSGRDIGTITVSIAQSISGNKQGTRELSLLTKDLKKVIEPELQRMARVYTTSPSIIDRLIIGIKDLFTKGKVSNVISRIKKSYKQKLTINQRIPVHTPVLTISKTRTGQVQKRSGTNIQAIIDMLNEQLHDQIQKNMGKGESKQVLNYRTGRFAKSAEIQTLVPGQEKGTMLAQVKYMKDPYAVFEKGGRLYKPMRDPKGIFGRSIRQLLQENKIATLRRVMVNTNG